MKKGLSMFLSVLLLFSTMFGAISFSASAVTENMISNSDLSDVVALAQVIAGWDIDYVEAALDPNGDGECNLEDVVWLSQNLAGWDDRPLSGEPFSF